MSNIIFMVNIKNESNVSRCLPYEYSIKSWRNWAKKNDCELFILDQYIFDPEYMKPNWYKLYVFDLLEDSGVDYENILIVDSDTIVHPNCPNLFDMSDGKFCAVHNEGSYDWVCRSIENYSKLLFDDYELPFWKYINSGLLLLNKTHRQLYQDIIRFYFENRDRVVDIQNNFGVGTDQPIINFFLEKNNVSRKFLPYEFNMQDMFRKEILDEDLTFTKLGWVYHFNAIPDNHNADKTLYWMKKTYEELYDNIT